MPSQTSRNGNLVAALQSSDSRAGQREVILQLANCAEVLWLLPDGEAPAAAPVAGGGFAVYTWTSEATLDAAGGSEGEHWPRKGTIVLADALERGVGLWFDAGQDHALLLDAVTVRALVKELESSGQLKIWPLPDKKFTFSPSFSKPSVTVGDQERKHMADIARTAPHLQEAWLVEVIDNTGHHVAAVVVGLRPEDDRIANAIHALVLAPLDPSGKPIVIPAPQPNDRTLLDRARQVGIRLR